MSLDKSSPDPRSVQDYIDETPVWSDGTETSSTPMTKMQKKIWGLAGAGKFFEGLVVFMTGVALPLIVADFGLNAAQKGMVSASSLFGILVGATALGGLADKFGRKTMFIVEMVIFAVFLALVCFSPTFETLVIFLFGLGLALGCDYPTAHMVISESIPGRTRGRLVLGAFGFQAVGALVGAGVGYLILGGDQSLSAWRWMYATAIIPAIAVIFGRFTISESSHWLSARGSIDKAQSELAKLLNRVPRYPKNVKLISQTATDESSEKTDKGGFFSLFNKKNRRATILASVPWFLQDLGTYGIGIFTPTILASAVGAKIVHPHNVAAIVQNEMLAAKGAAFLDVFLIIGIIAAVLLTDKLGRIKLQTIGFIGCAIGLALASASMSIEGPAQTILLFGGFMLFNFMTNAGPNAQTYLISGEVFPTKIRGAGAGFAASFAKIGAVSTAFLFPILIKDIGETTVLYILIGTSLLGAIVTWLFKIETKGLNLEKI